MIHRLTADLVVVLHLLFIGFAVLGGLLVLRRRRWIWLHAPAALWAAAVAMLGWICPLTPLENWLRARSGGAGYPESFVEHYLLPVIYPAALTREIQLALGLFVVAVNGWIYARLARRPGPPPPAGRPPSP